MSGLVCRVLIGVAVVAVVFGYPAKDSNATDQEPQETTVEVQPSEELHSFHENPTYTRFQLDEGTPEETTELQGRSQTFFPSYFNGQPHGHSRPFYYQQEGAYSQRAGSYRQNLGFEAPKYESFARQRDSFTASSDAGHGILGSGNFGVIRGGTFYNDQDDLSEYAASKHNVYSNNFYNNGHGRPSFYFGNANPRPYQHEQFANFKDFADINTPSYSHYVLVYVNKNGSTSEETPSKAPKNIIERLAQLDLEKKEKKISASKRKLALLPPEKKMKSKTVTEKSKDSDYEPLLALS